MVALALLRHLLTAMIINCMFVFFKSVAAMAGVGQRHLSVAAVTTFGFCSLDWFDGLGMNFFPVS